MLIFFYCLLNPAERRLRDSSEVVSRSTSFVVPPIGCPRLTSNWSAQSSPNACLRARSRTRRRRPPNDRLPVDRCPGSYRTSTTRSLRPAMMKTSAVTSEADQPNAPEAEAAVSSLPILESRHRPPRRPTRTRWLRLVAVIALRHPRHSTAPPSGPLHSESLSDVCLPRSPSTNLSKKNNNVICTRNQRGLEKFSVKSVIYIITCIVIFF